MPRIRLVVKLAYIALTLTLTLTTGSFAVAPFTSAVSFYPDSGVSPIGLGSSAVLIVTTSNASGSALSNVAFTDDLPAGILTASVPQGFSDCGGTVLAAPDASSFSYSGGAIANGASCHVMVNVTPSNIGTYTDGGFTVSTDTLSAVAANADLQVQSYIPSITKSFQPAIIPPGGTSTLIITIDNTSKQSSAQDMMYLTDNLPSGLVIATPSGAANTCGGTLTANAGTTSVMLANGNVAMFSSCTITIDVTAAAAGSYGNVTGQLQVSNDYIQVGLATAVLNASSIVAIPALNVWALIALAGLLLLSAAWFLKR